MYKKDYGLGGVHMKKTIQFREMREEEYRKFLEVSVTDYSKDLVKAGLSKEEDALKNAKESFNELLPHGRDTKNHNLYVVADNEKEIGHLWYHKDDNCMGIIYSFLINEEYRRQGYGRATLHRLDQEAKDNGINTLVLNVFKYNKPANSLYESVGYTIGKEDGECRIMVKQLSS